MKFFHKAKDGGSESNVTGDWLIEWKPVFSIVLLRFDKGSREAYHDHAFNAISWILKGRLRQHTLIYTNNSCVTTAYVDWLRPSIFPVYTSRNRMHQVFGEAEVTWALSFRGPWKDVWKEYLPKLNKFVSLTHGRKVVTTVVGSNNSVNTTIINVNVNDTKKTYSDH